MVLFGGVVSSWKQPSGDEVLYIRPDAVFDKSKPISGGIPHCFPQVGEVTGGENRLERGALCCCDSRLSKKNGGSVGGAGQGMERSKSALKVTSHTASLRCVLANGPPIRTCHSKTKY